MDHKKAIDVLISLLDRHPFDADEKQAVLTAIGVLSRTSLSEGRIKKLKAKREKSTQWNTQITKRRS